jgi:dienelactone hydrolase
MLTRTHCFPRLLFSLGLIFLFAACGAGPASSVPAASSSSPTAVAAEETARLFDYDASAPLDEQTVKTEKREGYTKHEITYASPKGGRVPALLLVPDGPGPFAGILLMHGAPGTYERVVPEAETLVARGAVILAINAPFSRGSRLGNPGEMLHFDERDRGDQIQLIVDLRRAVDLLLSRPDVAKDRLAYSGRSFGGAQGGLLAGVEKRIKAYALVVGDGGLVSHFTGPDDTNGPVQTLPPEQVKRWLAALEPIEPIRWVGRAAPAHLLFQNGRQDLLVPEADGRAYQEAGSEPKTVLWYDAGHQLDEQATRDRHVWLAERIGIAPPAPAQP